MNLKKNRYWILVFVVLAVLGTLAVVINWAYTAGQQLTPEHLRAARDRWAQHRPADYDLKIVIGYANAGKPNRYNVQVRGGTITGFTINDKEPDPTLDDKGRRMPDEERRRREHFDVDGLFDDVETFLEQDARDGRKSYLRARFDKKDGHLVMFTRRYQNERQHINVELTRVNP